jgi:chaperone modulatory protein CbpM
MDAKNGASIDDLELSLEEFAHACAVGQEWVMLRVESSVIATRDGDPASWRFNSADLMRARLLAATERTFDANPEAAALVVDLIEEVRQLRRLLERERRTAR